MNHIYTVTVVEVVSGKFKSARCWGYLFTYEQAEELVLANATDMFEDCYQYAVIEKVPPGLIPSVIGIEETWFEKNGKKISKRDKPVELQKLHSFAF